MANGATGAVTDNRTVGMTTKTVPTQHFSYLVEIQALFAEIDAISDNAATPTYMNPGDMIKALQGLYISELLGLDEDSADEERRNDNDISLMEGSATNRDYTLGGSESLQSNLGDLIEEYSDIFSNSGRAILHGRAPIELAIDTQGWETNPNRAASRKIRKSRPKIQRGNLKCGKWIKVSPRKTVRRNLFVKSEFGFLA